MANIYFGSQGIDEELQDTGDRLKRWLKRYSGKRPQLAA
jgi:hypothetical protein